MRPQLFVLALCLLMATASATVNVNAWGNWSSTQGLNGIYYMNTSNYFTEAQMGWNGTAWNASNYGLCHFQQFPNGRVNGAIGTNCFPVWEWIATEAANVRINGSVVNRNPGGGDGMKLWIRKDNQLVGFVPVGVNATVMNFNFNLSTVVGSTISIIMDQIGTASYDSFSLENVTIYSHTGPANDERFLFRVADEQNPASYKTANVTVSNSTNSTSFNPAAGVFWFNKSAGELPSGIISIEVKNSSCLTGSVIPRSIAHDTAAGGFNSTLYLLCDGAVPVYTLFRTVDSLDRGIDGVLVKLQRLIGSSYATVTSAYSTSGQVTVPLEASATYLVTASKDGYYTFSAAVTPSTQGYRLVMVNSTSPEFHTLFEDITFNMSPYYVTNGTQTFTYFINSSNNSLVSYGIDMLGPTGAVLNQSNASNPAGSTVTLTMNVTPYSKLTFVGWFLKAGYARYNASLVYYPWNMTFINGTSLTEALDNYKANAPNNFFTGIIVLLIAALLGAWVTKLSNPTAGGIVAVGVIAFFGFFLNFLPGTAVFLLILFVASVIYFLRARG